MEFGWSKEYQDFYDQVIEFGREHLTPQLQAELDNPEEGITGPALRAVRHDIEDRGWLKMTWPVEMGGEGKSLWYQFFLSEVLGYQGIPVGGGNNSMIAPAIQRFGSEEQ